MRKTLLFILLAAITSSAHAQWAQIKDSVELGAGYANQTWYSLQNDEQKTAPKNEWDLAFNLVDFTATILVNNANNVSLWAYPKSDKSGWSAGLDTNGLSTWPKRYNTDTSWTVGAMGRYADPSNMFDLDWGVYDLNTHYVVGDSIYVIKLANGNYKRLIIDSLISKVFYFRYSDLDGTNEMSKTIAKGDYQGKLFAYYSIQNNQAKDREPETGKWDLLFTTYTSQVAPGMNYTVSGVLHNKGVEVAEINNVADVNTYNTWTGQNYKGEINMIGYDWKEFDMNTNSYILKNDRVYLVHTMSNDYWKVVFTGFESANGKFVFNKQKLYSTSVEDVNGNKAASMTLFPNPSNGAAVNVAYNINTAAKSASIDVYDMTGKVVYTQSLAVGTGVLHQHQMPTNNWAAGNYIVTVTVDGARMQQHLSVK